MKPEAQRIAIAEACGYKMLPDYQWFYRRDVKDKHPTGTKGGLTEIIPDYIHDLNAMHEAEKVLTEEQKLVYCSAVYAIANGYQVEPDAYIGVYFEASYDSVPEMVCAAAYQRAEAFLKTKGLWIE